MVSKRWRNFRNSNLFRKQVKMKINLPENVNSGGNYLTEAGTYHLAVNEVYDGVTAKGTPIDGFIVDFQVLDGTTEGQAGKTAKPCVFQSKAKPQGRRPANRVASANGVFDSDQFNRPVGFGKIG